MKKYIVMVCLSLTGIFKAQTAKELVGKWQLVEAIANNQPQDTKKIFGTDQVFQTFKQDSGFESVVGKETNQGKWELSKEGDAQILTIVIDKKPTKFKVDYFDANKRTVSFMSNGVPFSFSYKKI